jgi:hypothetical protein
MRLVMTPERRRLLASLVFNFVAKVPGIAAVFIILPLVSQSLGTAIYGELLSALALGSAFTLPFGGINAVGRRLLGVAVGAKDKREQANVFVTTTFSITVVACVVSVIMVGTTASSWSKPVFVLVSLLPVIAGVLNAFDNIRASFNEHYITAVFQLIFQTGIYGGVYILGLSQGSILLAGLVLQSPYLLASLATLIYLLIQRSFLLTGKIESVFRMVIPAIGVTLADGSLTLLLNLSVYWLKLAGHAEFAAWVGTFARLFQSFMSPVLLVLFPVTTYISIRWRQMTPQRQLLLHKLFLLLGCTYGLAVGGAMAIAGPYYIDHMFKLTVHGDAIDVLALSLFMGAVIAQKSYAMLLYAVSEARFVSFGSAVVALLGTGTAVISSFWWPASRVVDLLFGFMGFSLPVLLFVSSHRYRQACIDDLVG